LRSGGVANHRRAPGRAATPALRHIATPLRRNRARDHVATLVSGPGGIDHATTHPSDHAHATTLPSGRSVTSRQTPPPSRPPALGPATTPPTGRSVTSRQTPPPNRPPALGPATTPPSRRAHPAT